MALRDQPYIPLYVKDFTSDEKLRMCSPSAVGVYIFLMCILHREREYGKLQLRKSFVYTKANTKSIQTGIQNEIQNRKFVEDLYSKHAANLAKQMPFEAESIKIALLELDYYGVIKLEGNSLIQPRMVRDGEISETRRKSIKKRWNEDEETDVESDFVYTNSDTKQDTNIDTNNDTNAIENTEYANEYNNNIIIKENKGVKGERKPFAPPTLEDVMTYCESRSNEIDAIAFYDFYEANGWVQGKQGKPLKDWKAAVRYWERNGVNPERNGTGKAGNKDGGLSALSAAAEETRTRHSTI